MAGSSFGEAFRISTFGESHGPAIGVVIDGCPPGIEFDEEFLLAEMSRRRPGSSKVVTQRKEDDHPELISGVFEGKTSGTPIMLLIRNKDAKSKDYDALRNKFRPGHADYSYWKKYGIRDHRGSGRASARETAARVAAGALAKMVLAKLADVSFHSCIVRVGALEFALPPNWQRQNANPYFLQSLSVPLSLRTTSQGCAKRATPVAALSMSRPTTFQLD